MQTEGSPPPKDIPVIWADYNAVGLSEESGDNCIYSLHRDRLKELKPKEGTVVFIYDDDVDDNGNPEIFGYIATLEKISGFISPWRARPDETTWYRGPKTWNKENDL